MSYNSDFYNEHQEAIGWLNYEPPQKAGGKKIFDWAYYAKRDGNPVEVSIPVYLKKGKDGLYFSAVSKHLPGGRVEDTDIDRLRISVSELMRQASMTLTGIDWEDWLRIEVTGSRGSFDDSKHSASGANLKIKVSRLKRGIDPETGRELTIGINGHPVEFPKPSRIDREREAGDWLANPPSEVSFIRETPENMMAIQDILDRMDILKSSLANFLSQDKIEASLVSLDAHPLLQNKRHHPA